MGFDFIWIIDFWAVNAGWLTVVDDGLLTEAPPPLPLLLIPAIAAI